MKLYEYFSSIGNTVKGRAERNSNNRHRDNNDKVVQNGREAVARAKCLSALQLYSLDLDKRSTRLLGSQFQKNYKIIICILLALNSPFGVFLCVLH